MKKGQSGFKWQIALLIIAIAFLVIALLFIDTFRDALFEGARRVTGRLGGF